MCVRVFHPVMNSPLGLPNKLRCVRPRVPARFPTLRPMNRDARPKVAGSYAMEAASNTHTCYYRTGYDMSIPLSPKHKFLEFSGVSPSDREFFVTVKVRYYYSPLLSQLLPRSLDFVSLSHVFPE